MSSIKPAVSPSALTSVLDTMEVCEAATLRSLSRATGLGLSTVTRAAEVCTTHGILHYKTGIDPGSGRPCRILMPADGLLLPILTLTHGYGSVRAITMELEALGTAVTELHPATPPEEAARLLSRRCMTLLRGCSGSLHVTAPILLAEGMSPTVLREAVADVLGTPPLGIIAYGETVARAMTVRSFPAEATSLLFFSVGAGAHACLLLRDGKGIWHSSSLGNGLTVTLARALRSTDPSAEGVRRAVATLLADLCRFLRPDIICLEDPRGVLPDGSAYTPLLPDGVQVTVERREGMTVAELGAALSGRRMLWDKILFG